MREDFDMSGLEDAFAETQFLGTLGMRSVGSAPNKPMPGRPVSYGGEGLPQPASQGPLPPDNVLFLDGTRRASIGGRQFILSEEEIEGVLDCIGGAYIRSMEAELKRVRAAVRGEDLHPVPEEARTTHAQDLRDLSRSRLLEGADGQAPHDGTVLELRAGVPLAKEVSGLPGKEAGAGAAVVDPSAGAPLGATRTGRIAGNAVPADGTQSAPAPKSRRVPAGGSD